MSAQSGRPSDWQGEARLSGISSPLLTGPRILPGPGILQPRHLPAQDHTKGTLRFMNLMWLTISLPVFLYLGSIKFNIKQDFIKLSSKMVSSVTLMGSHYINCLINITRLVINIEF